MLPMIDPFTAFQTHSSLEIRAHVQTHTILEKTATGRFPLFLLSF
jgi:hypothetical protein